MLIPVGAALEARDSLVHTVRLYAERRSATWELRRLSAAASRLFAAIEAP